MQSFCVAFVALITSNDCTVRAERKPNDSFDLLTSGGFRSLEPSHSIFKNASARPRLSKHTSSLPVTLEHSAPLVNSDVDLIQVNLQTFTEGRFEEGQNLIQQASLQKAGLQDTCGSFKWTIFAYAATLIMMLLLCFSVALALSGHWPLSATLHVSPNERALGFVFFYELANNAMFTAFIPDSLALARLAQTDAASSGMLIGIFKIGIFSGFCVGWAGGIGSAQHLPFTTTKLYIKSALIVVTGSVLIFLTVALQLVLPSTHWFLLAGRFLQGIGFGIPSLQIQNMVALIPTMAQRPAVGTTKIFYSMLGMGLGPIVPSIARGISSFLCGLQAEGLELSMSLPIIIAMAYLWVAIWQPPGEEITCQSAAHLETVLDGHGSVDERSVWRRVGISCAFILIGSRGFTVAALQAATAMILEDHFEWSRLHSGLAVGASILMCIPARLVFILNKSRLSVSSWLRCCMAFSVVGSLLLFRFAKSATLLVQSVSLLVADGMLFSSMMLMSGMVEGLLPNFADPFGYVLSIDNVALIRALVIDGCGRGTGPPSARHSIEIGGNERGQDMYAMQQLGLTLVAILVVEVMLWAQPVAPAEPEVATLGDLPPHADAGVTTLD